MIVGYFGVPGCGKSTLAVKHARKALKRLGRRNCPYKHVYTNFAVKGCEKINFLDIGVYDITDSLIILDELTIDADNRDFKNFRKSSVEGFVYHRHDNNDIEYFTQQFDAVDKKIRNLTARLYKLRSAYLFPFTFATQIFREYQINEYTGDLLMGYRWAKPIEKLLDLFCVKRVGRVSEVCFRPRWYRFFDSFCRPYSRKPWTPVKWDDLPHSEIVSESKKL